MTLILRSMNAGGSPPAPPPIVVGQAAEIDTAQPITRVGSGPFAFPKIAAVQYGATDRAASATVQRQWLAKFDMVSWGIYNQTLIANDAHASMQAIRALNAATRFWNYVIMMEVANYRIDSITRTGSTVRVRYASKYPTMAVSGGSVGRVWIRKAEQSAYNGEWTVTSTGSDASGKWFEFNIGSATPSNDADSDGAFLQSSAASIEMFKKCNDANWFARHASTGEYVQWTTTYNNDDLNPCDTTPVDGSGQRLPQWAADYHKGYTFDRMPLLEGLMIDNFFHQPRVSANWLLDGVNRSGSDSTVASKYRAGHAALVARHRSNSPGKLFIGNTTGHNLSASGYPEVLDGAFMEQNLGQSWSVGGQDDNWASLAVRYSGLRTNVINPNLIVFGVGGTGANTAAQQADATTYRLGMCAFLMMGSNEGYYAFTPSNTYDTHRANGGIIHDERWANLGAPIEADQTGPRGISGSSHIWLRKYQNGVVMANTHFSATQTVPTSVFGTDLRRLGGATWQSATGQAVVSPSVNTGAAQTTNVSLGPRQGLILIRQPL